MKELEHKLGVLGAHPILGRDSRKNMSPSEDLCYQVRSITSEVHEPVDQQLHGIYRVPGRIIKDFQISLSRQQDVVHTPYGSHMIMQTDGHTRTEKGIDNGRFLARMKSSNMDADASFSFHRPSAVRIHQCFLKMVVAVWTRVKSMPWRFSECPTNRYHPVIRTENIPPSEIPPVFTCKEDDSLCIAFGNCVSCFVFVVSAGILFAIASRSLRKLPRS